MRKTVKVFSLALALMLIMSCMISVFAATNISIGANYTGDVTDALTAAALAVGKEGASDVTSVSVKLTSGKDGTGVLLSLTGNVLTLDAATAKNGDQKEVKKALKAFVDTLKDSDIPGDVQQGIFQQMQDSDSDVAALIIPMIFDSTKADLFTAYKWLAPFLGTLRVILGIGAVLIILMLLMSTVLDMCYIGLPMWRNNQDEKSGNTGKKPFGVSLEAISTVREVEQGMGEGAGNYKNAYVLYLKRRVLTYVVLSICLLYLIAGELGGLISWLLSLASGIV